MANADQWHETIRGYLSDHLCFYPLYCRSTLTTLPLLGMLTLPRTVFQEKLYDSFHLTQLLYILPADIINHPTKYLVAIFNRTSEITPVLC